MAFPALSVIIPVLNEASNLPDLLDDLRNQQQIDMEIIAADGGSTDNTLELLMDSGVIVVRSPRGRGIQMNAAAGQATGSFLLFLHADSRIRDRCMMKQAVSALSSMIRTSGRSNIAGHFPLKFIRTASDNSLAFRYIEAKTGLNRQYTTNGDQGLLIPREYFIRLKGFDESMPFLEDQKLAESIRKTGTWITLPGTLLTSARRFEVEGFYPRYILMSMIMGAWCTGLDEFFIQMPSLYRSQHETGKLFLTPYFRALRRLMFREWGFEGTLRAWSSIGSFVSRNCWQLFLLLDIVWNGSGKAARYPLLSFYDRYLAGRMHIKAIDALTATFCFLWIMGILMPYFHVSEAVNFNRNHHT